MPSLKRRACCILSAEPAKHRRSNRGLCDIGAAKHRALFVPPSERFETYTSL